MAKRQVFFSFQYSADSWRASQVRNMGKVDDNSQFSDNDWEEVKKKTDSEIKKWIDSQFTKRSCLVVLIGANTSGRKWITYEIEKAYELGKGIVGIYIHGLKDNDGAQATKGANPFYQILNKDGKRLSSFVTAFDPPHTLSSYVYNDISENIEQLIEDAIADRGTY
jgi:hypothetical protein